MFIKYCWIIKLIELEIVQSINQISYGDVPYQVAEHLVCFEYLVSGPKYNVSDQQLHASSEYNVLHAAKWGRLNTSYVKDKHIGGWAANKSNTPQYIQVSLNELSIVQAIATQGRNRSGESDSREQYVTKYHVYYKLNNSGEWYDIRGSPGQDLKDFQGNNDSNSIHINKLPCAEEANDVRIWVNASHNHPSMRFDVIGCPVSQVSISPDCEFEHGICGWKEDNDNDSVNWKLKNGANSVPESPKMHDHTYKNDTGSFAYLKSISSHDRSGLNRSAQLVTMIRKSRNTRCLHLWHSGSDPSFGFLTLSVIGCENVLERCISKQVRDFTQEWNHISVDVSRKDYKLIVEGTITSEDDGYLAIDDISLTEGYCQDCTFEDGFCNWSNEENSWKRIIDDSQRYIVISGDKGISSTKATLLGPEVDTGYKSSCLSFSYNMSGDENNSFTVSMLLKKENLTLGNLRGNDYDGWRNAFFAIINNGEEYKIQFVAFVTYGNIGLDNISLVFEPCPVITTTIAAPSKSPTTQDSITTARTWTNDEEKYIKTSRVLVGVAVGVVVLGLVVLIVIGIGLASRRRRSRSSAATFSKQTDHTIALSVKNQLIPEGNEVSIDIGQEYENVMSGKSESASPDPTYGNNKEVQSTHETRLINNDCEYAVVSKPKRDVAQETQEEQTYDHLDTGENVPDLDDETYDHVNK